MFHEPESPYQLNDVEPREEATVLGADERLSPAEWVRRSFRQRLFVVPLILFVLSAGIFSAFAWNRVGKRSTDPHFIYLADTFNTMVAATLGSEEAAEKREGKLPFELNRRPPHRNDWASFWEVELRSGETVRGIWLDEQGHGRFKLLSGKAMVIQRKELRGARKKRRYFVSFPPGPSALMMPFVAAFGYDFNDVLFTILFAALNVALMFMLLRRLSEGGRTGRGRRENLWLTVLFGFGTAHLWCSVLGQVWFTALVIGVTFTLLYLHFAIDARRPLLAGVCLALAFASRTPLVFASLFFYAFVFFPGGKFRRKEWGEAIRKIAWFSAPCIVVGLSLLYMNHLRFGSLLEFGHTYLATGSLGRIQTYGLFNFHFLSKNLSALLTLMPRLQPDAPYIIVSKHGMSLFLTTPVFIYLFRPLKRASTRDKFWWRLLWVTVAVVAIPGLFYQNTGYEQFGYRFALDYTPYLILLLAVGRRPLSRVFKALVIFSIGVNAFGAVTFKRIVKFYSSEFFV